ncbi:hypothetical protein P4H39_18840 [Paenibacillus lautus]|jgi:hypothetical protein|uniref:hypothetical protein n=1 Tax=Paenibacillus lautus TaxID=1401 RepID=UPI002DB8C0AD|nr:hypothetical protein [Paenibacillus lautus]MEC0204664.1 hypothetical protein [Paenibacillus lautus]
MTISKKGNKVGQEEYRWLITPSTRGIITLTMQHIEVKGQLLRIVIESDIDEFGWSFPERQLA